MQEFHTSIKIVSIELRSLAQLFKCFRKALQAFERARQAPVGRRKALVDLKCIAKLKRRFLILFVFQVNFAFFHVGDFCFFGTCAATDYEYGRQQDW